METVSVRETSIKYGRTIEAPARITAPDDIAEMVREIVENDAREHFVVIHLAVRSQVIGYQIVSIGTANSAIVHPREVFQAAIHIGAVSIAVAHNHPSGIASPSSQDEGVTKRLAEAGEILGIPVIDHVVVSDSDFYSFRTETDMLD